MSLLMLGASVIFAIYAKMSMDGSYVMLYEELALYLILGMVAAAVLFIVIEHVLAWRR